LPRGITRQEVKPNPNRVRFCFDYLQPNHPKFPISACSKEFLQTLLCDIVRYGEWTVGHFKDMNNNEHRHLTNFKETSEPDGFSDIDPTGDDLWTEEAWQFALPGTYGEASAGWRIHGFIVDDMFHIVWLDPEHKLCEYTEFHEARGLQSPDA